MAIKAGDFGTAFKPGAFRLGVKVIKVEGKNIYGQLLSVPEQGVIFSRNYFIARGDKGGMMLLEQQIEGFPPDISPPATFEPQG